MESELLTGRCAHAKHLEFLRTANYDAAAVEIIEAAFLSGVLHGATGGTMPVPAALTGHVGAMFYAWDRGRHHLELEFTAGEPAYFFYGDRVSGESWGQEYAIGDPLPDRVRAVLDHFHSPSESTNAVG
jgi:hypothetical protein